MQDSVRIRGTLDMALLEVASVLAEGYMFYRKGWRLARDSGGLAGDGSQAEVSERFTENRLDYYGPLKPLFLYELTPPSQNARLSPDGLSLASL